MKTTIESLDFPSEIKNKLKMKVSTANLKLEFLLSYINAEIGNDTFEEIVSYL